MHPATDESAAYAFGRFVTIRIQPPASLSPRKKKQNKRVMNGCLQTGWTYCVHLINDRLARDKKKKENHRVAYPARADRNMVSCLQRSVSFTRSGARVNCL